MYNEELTMIRWLKWPRPMKGPAMSTSSTSKLIQALWQTTITLQFKPIDVLSKSFQKKKSCGKCGRSHNHGECPAYGHTCHQCDQKNHWSQMYRAQRNSSTGHIPSPHRQHNREDHQATSSTSKVPREGTTSKAVAQRKALPRRQEEVATREGLQLHHLR